MHTYRLRLQRAADLDNARDLLEEVATLQEAATDPLIGRNEWRFLMRLHRDVLNMFSTALSDMFLDAYHSRAASNQNDMQPALNENDMQPHAWCAACHAMFCAHTCALRLQRAANFEDTADVFEELEVLQGAAREELLGAEELQHLMRLYREVADVLMTTLNDVFLDACRSHAVLN